MSRSDRKERNVKRRWKVSKRWMILAPMIVACGWVWSQQATGPAGAPIPGDLNGDGQVTITDAGIALQEAVGIVAPSDVHPHGLPSGDATPTQIQHGRYEVISSGCSDCHNRGTNDP